MIYDDIREWAEHRGLYEKGDPKTQLLKLQEEIGELSRSILKQDKEEFIDAIGDCVVVLTNLAELGNKLFNNDCLYCHGQGGYYEDVAGDGGSRMYIECGSCYHITIEDCIESAYNEIKTRKGKMQNGTFVKDIQ